MFHIITYVLVGLKMIIDNPRTTNYAYDTKVTTGHIAQVSFTSTNYTHMRKVMHFVCTVVK